MYWVRGKGGRAAYIFSSTSGFKYGLLLHASFSVFLFLHYVSLHCRALPSLFPPRFAIGGSAAGVRPQRAQAAAHSQPDTPPLDKVPFISSSMFLRLQFWLCYRTLQPSLSSSSFTFSSPKSYSISYEEQFSYLMDSPSLFQQHPEKPSTYLLK